MAGTLADPETLSLDEPAASVDKENTAIIGSIVGNLKKDGRTLVIMTTHDLEDCLLIMKEGRIEEARERS
jgi:energy-coupling factor transporter ATP-binding protein EcfA2